MLRFNSHPYYSQTAAIEAISKGKLDIAVVEKEGYLLIVAHSRLEGDIHKNLLSGSRCQISFTCHSKSMVTIRLSGRVHTLLEELTRWKNMRAVM